MLILLSGWVEVLRADNLDSVLTAADSSADQSLPVTGPDPMIPSFLKASDVDREWKFRVFLDDKEIGFHHFYLDQEGVTKRLRSVADFEYKLMFVTLYEYEHENNETWNGDCLHQIESSTDANGQPFAVNGSRGNGAFTVSGEKGQAELPECIMTFAYWNPAFLKEDRLLNSQNGEFLEVNVSEPVREERMIQGQLRPSYRYKLVAKDLKLDLWYSEDDQWLGLESEARGGRTLRYELF